jgi:hypothetical protein
MVIDSRVQQPQPQPWPLGLVLPNLGEWQCPISRSQPPPVSPPLSMMEEMLGDG